MAIQPPNYNRLFSSPEQQKPQTGTGYTNLNKFFGANQNNKLGQKVSGNLQSQIGSVQGQLGEQKSAFESQSQQNRLDTAQNREDRDTAIGRFGNADNAGGQVSQEDVKKFEQFRGGQYAGPSGLQDTQALASQAGELRAQTSNLSPSGTQELLRRSVGGNGRYTQGQQRLDSLLIDKSGIREVGRNAAALGGEINRANVAAQGQAQALAGQAQQFSKDTMDKLTESRQRLSNDVDKQLVTAQAQEAARLDNFSRVQQLLSNPTISTPNASGVVGSEVSGTSDIQLDPQGRIKQALGLLGTSTDQEKELFGDQTKAMEYKNLANQLGDVNNLVNSGQVAEAQADQIKSLFSRIGETSGVGAGLKSFGSLNDTIDPITQEKNLNLQYDRAGANQTYQELLNRSRSETGLVGRAKEQNLDYMKLLNERLTNQAAQNVGRTGIASEVQANNINALDTLAGKSSDLLEFQKNRSKYAAGQSGLNRDSFKKYVEAQEAGIGSLSGPTITPGTKDPTFEQALMSSIKPITGMYDANNPILGTAANLSALPITMPISLIKNAPALVSGAARGVGKAVSSIFCFTGDTDIMMENGSYKKIKDIKVNDKVAIGGKVKAVGQGLIKDLYSYKGFKVSGHHAIYEDGKWLRVENANVAIPIGKEKESLVYPIVTETHLMVTKAQGKLLVSADMEEVDDTYNIKDCDILKKLNRDSTRNKKIDEFLVKYENRKL